jgi:hypothetical protein
VLDRRLGLPAVIGVVVVALALAIGLSQLLEKDDDADGGAPAARVTATATPCTDAAEPFGTPPDTFKYEKVSEKTRESTVRALDLDEAGGKVEMRAARRTGLTLGTLVRVPSKDPAAYAGNLVSTAESAGAPVTKRAGYAVLPLQGGTVVAVGVRGCATILISAQDSNAVPFLADAVFSAR